MVSRYDENSGSKGLVGLISAGVAFVFFLILVFSTYYTIDQGERGVVLHYGAIDGISEPGLHFKYPFVTSVEKISLRPYVITYGGGRSPLEAYSADQQPAKIRISVNMHATDPTAVYTQAGSLEQAQARLVDPKVYEQLKNVFGKFNAVEAIQERAKLNQEVFDALSKAVAAPMVIDSVQIENIEFSNEYEHAVEERMQETVKQQQAEAEKQRAIINADAAAYSVKAAADAKAHQIEVQGEAEAKAIRARGDALKDNPGLPQLVTAERWDGRLPTTMVPGSSIPMVTLK